MERRLCQKCCHFILAYIFLVSQVTPVRMQRNGLETLCRKKLARLECSPGESNSSMRDN